MPVSEKLSQQILSLPNYPELTEPEIEYIIERINSFD
jgi:dTDP-4-amino-4,6-dideoxygalactose transaminase